MLAEARALAKLSHPNVVAVYDASDFGDELYIAMELVDGRNLRRWVDEHRPTPPAIVAAMIEAGRGLAAAHAAGLVHGDIKPENILVGDRIVKVADFGLARAERDASTGGTPAYMAPEQLAGKPADARSDQYAFAVTLAEALAGRRPIAGAAPPGPARVSRAIARALASDPEARHPSIEAMLAALGPRRAQHWSFALVVIALAVVAVVIETRTGADTCSGGAGRVAAVLDPTRGRLAPRAAALVDAYGARWAAMARETCEATQRGEQSGEMLDLRMSCLDRRLDELAATATVAPDSPPDGQVRAASELSLLDPCADRDRLASVLPPSAVQRDAVADARKDLARIAARQKTTGYKGALDEARALATRTKAIGYGPLDAETENLVGKLETHASQLDRADDTIKRAIAAAADGHDDALLADLWATRIFVATARGRFAEALAYGEAAESEASRLADPAAVRGLIRTYVGDLLATQDRLPEALAKLEDAAQLLEHALGPDHLRVGEVWTSITDVRRRMTDLAGARAAGERAVRIFETALGRDHQDAAVAVAMLAAVSADEGDLERSLREYRDALARTLASAGATHFYTASARANVGETLRKLGRDDEARTELAAARDIYATTVGLDNDQALLTLASLAKLDPDPASRRRALEDLLAREIKLYGESHHRVADTLNDLGNAARDAGDLDGSAALFRRSLASYEAALGPNHQRLAVRCRTSARCRSRAASSPTPPWRAGARSRSTRRRSASDTPTSPTT